MTSTPRWHESLLPGELRDEWDGRRSPRDWIVDVLAFVLAAAIGASVLVDTWEEHENWLVLADIALGLASLALLWWRRSHPDAVGVLACAASAGSALAAGPALVAAFNVALRGSRRGILATAAVSAVTAVAFPLIYPTREPYALEVFIGAVIIGMVFGWGLFARVRRDQVLVLRERAARLEAEQRLHVDQAREAERRRIAREMHDVLAHRISLLSLHAGALEFRPDAPPEEVAEAAGVIRTAARAALEELRSVIGVLREGDAGDTPERPQPTLLEIPALVHESRAAGMRVSCSIDVAGAGEASLALGRTAYRVVQEGLTNARKHAPGAAVAIAVRGDDDGLVIDVVSRRPVGVAARAEPLPGAGSGLIGLRERVAIAGGELQHGPDAAGDFVLRATLPWTA